MTFKERLHDILLDYMNEDSISRVTKEIIDKLDEEVFACHDDIMKNEDFILEDIILYEDGIKWFVQEYLNKNE